MKKIKKILFLGNFDIEYCSEVHYKKTLEKMGLEVVAFREGKTDGQTLVNELTKGDIDMFFWVHTHGWTTPNIHLVLDECKRRSIPSVGYHLDLWLGIEREKDLKSDSYWKIDYFFSVDKLMVELLNSMSGMPKTYFLPAGVFEDECYIGEFKPEYAHDVIFVGSRGYHPEWSYRPQLIKWLEDTYGDRFAQYGGGGKGTIRGKELNDLYASAKVVIGDTLCKDFKYPYYLSDRLFETTGRGGFIIHPYIKVIEELYKSVLLDNDVKPSDSEIVTYPFNNFEVLKGLIDKFINDDELRKKIQLNGFEAAKKYHTYTNRLSYLIETIEHEI